MISERSWTHKDHISHHSFMLNVQNRKSIKTEGIVVTRVSGGGCSGVVIADWVFFWGID